MTEAITIYTPFNDVGELADNFATRVSDSQVVLPYAETLPDGVRLAFRVLLVDETVAFEGTGTTIETRDNGEEYPPEYRYDVTFGELELSGMSEVMFERFLQEQASQQGQEPGTGEVDVAQLEAVEDAVSVEAAPVEASAPFELGDDAFEVGMEEGHAVEVPSADAESGAAGAFDAAALEAAAPEADAGEAGAVEADGFEAGAFDGGELSDGFEGAPAALEVADASAAHAAEDPYALDGGATEAFDADVADDADDWAPPSDFGEASQTQAVSLDELSPASEPPPYVAPAMPAPPPAPRGTLPRMHGFEHGVLTRASLAASWAPTITPRPEPAVSSGVFEYGGPLPRPEAPPHPDMPEEARVAPAPSPSAPWSRQPLA